MTATDLQVIKALTRRALNEILRVPGAAIPGILAPTIFMIGLSGVFGAAAGLERFPADSFRQYIIAVGLLQGASFTGAATGVNLARDIEAGWFDRLLVCPAPRRTLLAGIVASAALRSLLPGTFLFVVAMLVGVDFPGVGGTLIAVVLIMGMACAAACWGVALALKFRTQQAAPLMQIGMFIAILFTTAYAPKELLAGWLEVAATINPVTLILDGVRQGFVQGVNLEDTLAALAAVSGLVAVLGAFAARGMRRYGV